MAKYHINPKSGEVGPCRAQSSCPFGGIQDHYDTADAARAAYEAKQGSSFAEEAEPQSTPQQLENERRALEDAAAMGLSYKRGRKLRTADLVALPPGAVVRWPTYEAGERVYRDWSKQETGTWMLSTGESSRQVESRYLGGAGGNEQATFVSVNATLTDELPLLESKKPRKAPEAMWAIIRVSTVTEKVYLDHKFAREAQARKKLQELNRYDHLHHTYELVPMAEAKARVNA